MGWRQVFAVPPKPTLIKLAKLNKFLFYRLFAGFGFGKVDQLQNGWLAGCGQIFEGPPLLCLFFRRSGKTLKHGGTEVTESEEEKNFQGLPFASLRYLPQLLFKNLHFHSAVIRSPRNPVSKFDQVRSTSTIPRIS